MYKADRSEAKSITRAAVIREAMRHKTMVALGRLVLWLALDVLRRRWRAVFGRTPPAAQRKDLLGRMMACRLQEQAFGSLDRESLRFLDALARHGGSPRRQLKPGTVLIRDYQGQRHTVTVAADGFNWGHDLRPVSPPSPAPSPAARIVLSVTH